MFFVYMHTDWYKKGEIIDVKLCGTNCSVLTPNTTYIPQMLFATTVHHITYIIS